jgi:hypothetical protein
VGGFAGEYCPLATLTSQFPKNDPGMRALISGLFAHQSQARVVTRQVCGPYPAYRQAVSVEA